MTAKPPSPHRETSDCEDITVKETKIVTSVQGVHHIASTDDILYGVCELQVRVANRPPSVTLGLATGLEEFDKTALFDQYRLPLTLNCLEKDNRSYLGCAISTTYFSAPEAWSNITSLLEKNSHLVNRIVIEISEKSLLCDMRAAKSSIGSLKGLGCKVVINDFRNEFPTPLSLASLDVDFVKFDARMMRRARECSRAKDFLERSVDYVRCFVPTVIMDGVETADDFLTAKVCRATHVQGKFLSSPVDLLTEFETL